MVSEINPMILEELEETDCSSEVADLLRAILQKELEHRGEAQWWYTREYKPLIEELAEKYTKRVEGSKDED